jgi:hypothetical protein
MGRPITPEEGAVYLARSEAAKRFKLVGRTDPGPAPLIDLPPSKPTNSLRQQPTLRVGESKYPVFESLLRSHGLAPFRTEYQFHGTRLWRFDYAWPNYLIAVEIEGGAFAKGGGGHNRGRAFLDDMEKYNAAAMLNWRVMRYPPERLDAAIPEIAQLLGRT